jgi:hypothetical protein
MPNLRSPRPALELVAPVPNAARPLDRAELLPRLPQPLEVPSYG